MPENRVIIIAGPTASGKSALAIDVAKAIDGVVVNCDSMQVYKGMPIISACPTVKERAEIPHVLFEIYDPSVNGNVVDWLSQAVAEIKRIWQAGKVPVVVGGTGLYIDNLINGTTPIPETSAKVREEVAQMLKEYGSVFVYEKLKSVDPESAEKLNPNDTTRVRRAYEVWLDTGIKLSDWHQKPMIKKLPEAEFFIIKICPSADELDERCYTRFDKMINEGAVQEVQRLLELHLPNTLPAMKALGVPELARYLKGGCSLEQAVEEAKLHTRQYAKRQRTWFKNKLKADMELNCCYAGDCTDILQRIERFRKS